MLGGGGTERDGGGVMLKRRTSAVALSLAAVLMAAGCGGGDDEAENEGPKAETAATPGANITTDKLPGMSAQPSDFPEGYAQRSGFPKQLTTANECVQATAPGKEGLVEQFQSLGLQGCYLAVYTKERGRDSNSPGSGTFVFPDAAAAGRAQPVLRQAVVDSLRPSGQAKVESSEEIPVSGLGEEAVPGARFTISVGGARMFRLIFYFWRNRNAVTYVGGGDSLGDFNESSYLDLAKKVDDRAGK